MNKNPLLVVAIVGVAFLGIIAGVLVYRQMTLAAIRQDLKEAIPGFDPPSSPEEAAKGSVEFYERIVTLSKQARIEQEQEWRKRVEEMRASGKYVKESIDEIERNNIERDKESDSKILEHEKDLEKARAEYEAVKQKGK